jgi:hypothetical protein
VSDREFEKDVVTVAISARCAQQARFRLPGSNRGVPNHSTARVCNGSPNVSRDLLRRQTEASEHRKNQHIPNDDRLVFDFPRRIGTQAGATPTGRLTVRGASLSVIHGPKNLPHQRLRDLEDPGGIPVAVPRPCSEEESVWRNLRANGSCGADALSCIGRWKACSIIRLSSTLSSATGIRPGSL